MQVQTILRIEQILARDMPVIPIYHYAGVFMLNTQLKGMAL